MALPDVQKHFVSLHVSKYREKANFTYFKKLESHNGYSLFGIQVRADGAQTLAVTQKDKHGYAPQAHFKYQACRFILVRLNNDTDILEGVEYINGKLESFEKNYYIECDWMTKGKYLAFVEFDWDEDISDYEKSFSINTYGEAEVAFSDESN